MAESESESEESDETAALSSAALAYVGAGVLDDQWRYVLDKGREVA